MTLEADNVYSVDYVYSADVWADTDEVTADEDEVVTVTIQVESIDGVPGADIKVNLDFNNEYIRIINSRDEYKTDSDGKVEIKLNVRLPKGEYNITIYSDGEFYAQHITITSKSKGGGGSCVAAGTVITLADGTHVPVEDLTGDELLLVWNLHTGAFDTAPITFIFSDPYSEYEIIHMYFSDGTDVKVIYEHGFWNFNLNKYVYITNNNPQQYIGHWFNKQIINQDGSFGWEKVQLIGVEIYKEYTTAWSPVTVEHLCYYTNNILSITGGVVGLFNIFEVCPDTLRIDYDAYLADIEEYGLFTYEEFSEILYVPEEMFDAFQVRYFKVAMGKGMIDVDMLIVLVERFSELLGISS